MDPADEAAFPGIERLAAELHSWDWTFGKTPKFGIQTRLALADGCTATLCMQVKGGVTESCELDVPSDWLPPLAAHQLGASLVGERFCPWQAGVAVAPLLRQAEGSECQDRLQRLSDAVLVAMG